MNHCPIRLFDVHDALHILRCQRLEIQLIRNIEVGTYRLRIIIYNNRLIALFAERPGAVNRTEVKLDPLADTDRAGTEDKHLLPPAGICGFILAAKAGIVVRRLRRKFSRARIHHLKRGHNVVVLTHLMNLLFVASCQSGDNIVRELDSLGFSQQIRRQRSLLKRLFHLHDNRQLIDKPDVDLRDRMDRLIGEAAS